MIDNTNAYREMLAKEQTNHFDAISINVASPDTIRSWSHGEDRKSTRLNSSH